MEESVSPGNSLFVIAPYWHAGTWVFDDASRGLSKEPFVAGVPEVLNDLVSWMPNAREGFRLLFSSHPFPGAQAEFLRIRTESGGTWYKSKDGREGWLCPALFKYFSAAPKSIFAKAELLD